jgi:hypothetical protein
MVKEKARANGHHEAGLTDWTSLAVYFLKLFSQPSCRD